MRIEYILAIILVVLLGGGLLFLSQDDRITSNDDSYDVRPYVEIVDPAGFVNINDITLGELVGEKVILVDFLTYSCINCQRTFPYLNAWYDTYEQHGLEIVGIHTPEFAFEHDIDNVRAAMERFGIDHPIVLDNDYATWRAYGNRFWPRKYLIDINGNIVYDHIGEGAYEQTEAKIQELLAERAEALGESFNAGGITAAGMPVEENQARSPETYFGSERNEFLGNGMMGMTGPQTFVAPDTYVKNRLYLDGTWTIAPEYAQASGGTRPADDGARIIYRYEAKDVFLVAEADTPTTIDVFVDGEPITADMAGSDVVNGTITVEESTLYSIIDSAMAGEHLLELRVNGSAKVYAFTFG